jgi:hypothetical protein
MEAYVSVFAVLTAGYTPASVVDRWSGLAVLSPLRGNSSLPPAGPRARAFMAAESASSNSAHTSVATPASRTWTSHSPLAWPRQPYESAHRIV